MAAEDRRLVVSTTRARRDRWCCATTCRTTMSSTVFGSRTPSSPRRSSPARDPTVNHRCPCAAARPRSSSGSPRPVHGVMVRQQGNPAPRRARPPATSSAGAHGGDLLINIHTYGRPLLRRDHTAGDRTRGSSSTLGRFECKSDSTRSSSVNISPSLAESSSESSQQMIMLVVLAQPVIKEVEAGRVPHNCMITSQSNVFVIEVSRWLEPTTLVVGAPTQSPTISPWRTARRKRTAGDRPAAPEPPVSSSFSDTTASSASGAAMTVLRSPRRSISSEFAAHPATAIRPARGSASTSSRWLQGMEREPRSSSARARDQGVGKAGLGLAPRRPSGCPRMVVQERSTL